MRIYLLAVGTRMPAWISEGYQEFARRLPADCALQLVEIPAGKRGKNVNLERILQQEGERMLAALPKGVRTVAMDVEGQAWSTDRLAEEVESWRQGGRDVALLVGGPEGLDPKVLAGAEQRWSLSPLTLPHPLVRVVIAEQIYRAWSMLSNHPYHR